MNIEAKRAELKKKFEDSVIALEEARAGRQTSNIHKDDSYWVVLNNHRKAHRALIEFNEIH